MPRLYTVQEHDSFKLRAVVALLQNHATYKNLTLDQMEAMRDVIAFLKALPAAFEAAPEAGVTPSMGPLAVATAKKIGKAK